MSRFFENKPGRLEWVLRLLIGAALGVGVLLVLSVWRELSGRGTAGTALAQLPPVFDSGSTGADGALEYTTPGTYVFNPRTLGIDPEGDNVFHFTTITIGAGVTVTLSGQDILGPVYWLASGVVQIDGIVDLSGEDGHPYTENPPDRRPSIPGPGGYSGGVWRTVSNGQPGLGPGGGCSHNGPAGNFSGNASHVIAGWAGGCGIPGHTYGNVFLLPPVGGSGGGGSGIAPTSSRGGGGAGGGGIVIASSASIRVNGSVLANGGDRGNLYAGGGSGGAIYLMSPIFEGAGSINAQGGLGAGNSPASYGRIRIDAFNNNFTGTTNPTAIYSVPYQVILPDNPPRVRVVQVNGATAPQYPTGSASQPDVTLDTTGAVTMTVQANYVPVGSVVQLYVYSETSTDQIINSTPLAGTLELSTAVITVTLPVGTSRMFVRSDWTP